MPTSESMPPNPAVGWALFALKLLIVVLVVWFVGQAARDAWREIVEQGVEIHPWLALASAAAYLAGQAPMAWYWRKTLVALGQPAPFGPAVRAFYLSQIGKYVPGKATVVLIRTERMRRWGGRTRTIAAAVFLETLTVMAIGALLAAVLLVVAPPGGARETQSPWMVTMAALFAVFCLAPTIPTLAKWAIHRLAPPGGEDDRSLLDRGLTYGLTAQGWIAALLAWTGFGASVWLGAWSVGASDSEGWQLAPLWLLAAALPVVAGFVSLLPAGVLVREGLTLGILAPVLGEAGALATTLATRVIWVAAESIVCGILGVVTHRGPDRTDP